MLGHPRCGRVAVAGGDRGGDADMGLRALDRDLRAGHVAAPQRRHERDRVGDHGREPGIVGGVNDRLVKLRVVCLEPVQVAGLGVLQAGPRDRLDPGLVGGAAALGGGLGGERLEREPRLVGVKPVVSRSENLAVSPLGAAWRDYQMVSVGRGRKFDKGPSRTRDPWR